MSMAKKSTKQIVSLVLVFFLIAVFGTVYIVGEVRLAGEAEAAEAAMRAAIVEAELSAEQLQIISRGEIDLERVSFTADTHSFSIDLVREDEGVAATLIYAGSPDVILNQHHTRSMLRDVYLLRATNKVLYNVDNPADFGIGRVVATAYFNDGSREVVRLGTMTPDRTNFYAMVDGNPGLFLISSTSGNRLLQNVTDLVDRTLPDVNSNRLIDVSVRARDWPAIEFGWLGEDEGINLLFTSHQLSMTAPFMGMEMIPVNFDMLILEPFAGFRLRETVELFVEEAERDFGFGEPLLEVKMEDAEGGSVHLIFGDDHGNGMLYTMLGGQPHVFLAERRFIEGLLHLNPFHLINRFVALVDIDGLERITIQSAARGDYEIYINHFRDDLHWMQIAPVINGIEVDDDNFRGFYQALISIAYDLATEPQEEPGDPDIVITYHFIRRDFDPVVVEFFLFDANFYAVRQQEQPLQFITNNFDVNRIFELLEELIQEGV